MVNKAAKQKILNLLIARKDFLGKYSSYDGLLTFLAKVWPIRSMPSNGDDRFNNQYDNIFQHCINNQDWTDEQLYVDQLNIINGEDKYFSIFLETVVSPEVRNSRDEILFYVSLINNELKESDEQLILTDYFEELPVYKLRLKDQFPDLPQDISPNLISFFLRIDAIDQYPCFSLIFDKWNDYNYVTQFGLNYYTSHDKVVFIGYLKIMKRHERITRDVLSTKFTELSKDFCSLGQSEEYYINLKTILPNSYQSVLLAIRDAALFPKILEEFENDYCYIKSLTRNNDAEQLARTVRFELQGGLKEYFQFSYNYKPPYSEKRVIIHFDFNYEQALPHRIYAMIGKNGAGKTSILSTLAKELSLQNPEFISPVKPLHSKYFTVSYSFFDSFEIPEKNASFNYIYCGLKKKDGSILTEEEQIESFLSCVKKIDERSLITDWYQMLLNFLPVEQLNLIFVETDILLPGKILAFKESEFIRIRRQFSSGESIILFILTKIISEIRFDSLILYDEPETHLHPNAISNLMNTLFDLVNRFRSFCILATHSPLIIQEIHARDIIILKREDNELLVKKMNKDSFGENLTVITEEIFNNRDVNKYHLELMKKLVAEGKSFDEIASIFQYEGLPVNLNTRLYLKSLISGSNAQS